MNSFHSDELKTTTALVMNLFAELKDEFGDLFEYKKDRYTPRKALEWAKDILSASMTPEEFNIAKYKAVKQSEYPVDRAYTFINLGRDEVMKRFIDVRKAYHLAATQQYQHETIYEAASRVGFWELKTQHQNISYPIFERKYKEVCIEYINGARFSLPEDRHIEFKNEKMSEDSPFAKDVQDFLDSFLKRK